MLTSMYLYDPVSEDTLVLWPGRLNDLGIYVKSLDFGFPEIRENTQANPGADGVTDYTTLIGARAVSVEIQLNAESPASAEDELARWLAPRLRPQLFFTFEGTPEKYFNLRASNMSRALSMENLRSRTGVKLLQWVCPDGVAYATDATIATITGYSDSDGLVFPITFPITFDLAAATNTITINTGSNYTTYPIFRIYGGVSNPVITNSTTGRTVTYSDDIDSTKYVEIDIRANTATEVDISSGTTHNVLTSVSEMDWWLLEPGDNDIVFTYDYIDLDARVDILYQTAYL